MHGGRYTPPRSFATLYLCTTRACVVAEFDNLAQRQGLEPAQLLPRILYQYRVELDRTLDLTVEETRRTLAVTLEDLETSTGLSPSRSATLRLGSVSRRSSHRQRSASTPCWPSSPTTSSQPTWTSRDSGRGRHPRMSNRTEVSR